MAAQPRPEAFILLKRLLPPSARGLAACLKSRGRPLPLRPGCERLVPEILSGPGRGLCEAPCEGARAPSSLVACYLITGSVISWSLWLGVLMGLLVTQEGQAEPCVGRKHRVCGRVRQAHSRNGTDQKWDFWILKEPPQPGHCGNTGVSAP